MATITPEMLLGDIVTNDPHAIDVFKEFGLDFCCHGRRSLHQACQEANLDMTTVLEALNTVYQPQQETLADMDTPMLTAHILSTHHRYLWSELPTLAELVDKVAEVHGPTHVELLEVRQAFHQLRQGIEPHLRHEETLLFPQINLLSATPDQPVPQEIATDILNSQHEHDNAGVLLAQINQLTNGYVIPAEACPTYTNMLNGLRGLEEDMHLHVHKENNILFPRFLNSHANHD